MPVVNQVNFNPFAFRRALFDASQRHGVVLEAYSPLGTGRLLSDPAVGAIAARPTGRQLGCCFAGACRTAFGGPVSGRVAGPVQDPASECSPGLRSQLALPEPGECSRNALTWVRSSREDVEGEVGADQRG